MKHNTICFKYETKLIKMNTKDKKEELVKCINRLSIVTSEILKENDRLKSKVFKDPQKALYDVYDYYISLFEKKHDYELYDIVHDDYTVLCFADTYLSISDIIEDIDRNYPKGLIFQWQEDSVDYSLKHSGKDVKWINLRSYAMGLRYEQLKDK